MGTAVKPWSWWNYAQQLPRLQSSGASLPEAFQRRLDYLNDTAGKRLMQQKSPKRKRGR